MSYNNSRLKGGFGQCTSNVMRDPNIKMRDKAVYSYLCVFADSQTNLTHVSVKTMAAELNVTPSTIIRALKELQSNQIVKRIARGRGQATVTQILK